MYRRSWTSANRPSPWWGCKPSYHRLPIKRRSCGRAQSRNLSQLNGCNPSGRYGYQFRCAGRIGKPGHQNELPSLRWRILHEAPRTTQKEGLRHRPENTSTHTFSVSRSQARRERRPVYSRTKSSSSARRCATIATGLVVNRATSRLGCGGLLNAWSV